LGLFLGLPVTIFTSFGLFFRFTGHFLSQLSYFWPKSASDREIEEGMMQLLPGALPEAFDGQNGGATAGKQGAF